jgi:hypothetical protein
MVVTAQQQQSPSFFIPCKAFNTDIYRVATVATAQQQHSLKFNPSFSSIHCLFTVSQWLRQLSSSNHSTFFFLARHCLFIMSQWLRQPSSSNHLTFFIPCMAFNTLPIYRVATVATGHSLNFLFLSRH